MTYRILIAEDDRGISEALAETLENYNMKVQAVRDFRSVMEEFREFAPHLVLMDIKLPFMDGYHWCREMRKESSVPIVFISSASDNMSIVMAINMGGDDFIAKPFDRSVLVAKVQAVLRRTYDLAAALPKAEYRGAVLDSGDFSLTRGGEKAELTKNEYRIMQILLDSCGRVVSREKLMETLWESDSFVDDNTLTVNVARLRRKLAQVGLSDCIETKIGAGYLLRKEE